MADTKKPAPEIEPEASDAVLDEDYAEVNVLNRYGVFSGRNMAASTWALNGFPRFVTLTDKNIILRTKQEAYRLAAWLVVVAERHDLPDEEKAHSLDTVIAAVEEHTDKS
jgi:hypothetical protein